ncbi:MAG: DUF1398 domain-containing protein [Erysipelotrichaceae bacterium]
MFTKEQIQQAHASMQSGADFPKYVQTLHTLGVLTHEVSLSDGMWHFKGVDGSTLSYPQGIAPIEIALLADKTRFLTILHAHQRGEMDYPTFCKEAGAAGVERWITNFFEATVSYYAANGDVVDVEPIG